MIRSFIVDNLIAGVQNRTFSREWANITAVGWLAKGLLHAEDLQQIDEATAAREIEAELQKELNMLADAEEEDGENGV